MKINTRSAILGCALCLGALNLSKGDIDTMATDNQPPADKHVYKKVGQRELTIEITSPENWKKGDRRPAIVYFFGGGWTNGTPEQFRPQAEYFAKRGLVCARADYRVKSRDGVKPADCVEDARSAMRWVRANAPMLGVDPDRIVSSGGSAGGHLAACVCFSEGVDADTDDLSVSPRPNAMILYNPALDFIAFKESNLEKHAQGMDDETLRLISPLRLVSGATPPTLIVDGTSDFLYDQNKAFADKGKELGAPVEAYFADDQPHGFFNASPWLEKTTQRADEFLQAIGYLAPEPKVPLPSKERKAKTARPTRPDQRERKQR